MPNTESENYELLQLYQSSQYSISSLADDYKTESSISRIRVEHDYAKTSGDQNNEVFATQRKRRKLLAKSVASNNFHQPLNLFSSFSCMNQKTKKT